MKKTLTLAFVVLLITTPLASASILAWSQPHTATVESMATGGEGVYLYTGDNAGNISRYYQSNGTQIWSVNLDSNQITSLEYHDTADLIIGAGTQSEVAYALNPDGTIAWTYSAGFDSVEGILINEDTGNVFVIGYDINFDAYVVKLDSDGNFIDDVTDTTGQALTNAVAFNQETDQFAFASSSGSRTWNVYGTDMVQDGEYSPGGDSQSDATAFNGTWYFTFGQAEIHKVNESLGLVTSRTIDVNDIRATENNTLLIGDTGLRELSPDDLTTLSTHSTDSYQGVQSGVVGTSFTVYGYDVTNAEIDAFTTDTTIGGDTITALDLEIDPWMPFNEEQSYTVLLNETNTTTGDTNLTDVTADANVTIYNITNTTGFSEPIASVNNTTDTIRSYNQTGVVAVNATYNGNQASPVNLTVGNRNLSNIGIMPPEQWPCSFLGCDENPKTGDNPHNIGSPMQWLLLIIVIMVAATRFIENPWAGVGTGIMFSILVWVLGFIDLGSVLVTVFSGLLIGAMMARTQMGRGVTRDNEQSGIDAAQLERRR